MIQLSLFEMDGEATPPIELTENFLPHDEANQLLNHCLALEWRQNSIKIYGKINLNPRLELIIGEPGNNYSYSGIELVASPWTEPLAELKNKVVAYTGFQFQIVVGNLYRDGSDSIGWHSDNDSSMGLFPAIASISLGARRKFSLKSKSNPSQVYSYRLGHGDLLLMKPGCQENWLHQVPKTTKPLGKRINLTFRPFVN